MLGTGRPRVSRASAIGMGVAHGPATHRLKLALTYALTLAENGLNVLYPPHGHRDRRGSLRGLGRRAAVDRLDGPPCGRIVHVYDTRVFTLVDADLAADLVERSGRKARTPLTSPPA